MTDRLYYNDSYLREFHARVVESAEEGRKVYLDRTAFYPTSGGQPFDTGKLAGVPVTDVIDEGERIAHVLAGALSGSEVTGRVDWQRRFDHMQQHTGQHLLSAVLVDLFDAPTVSFHLGTESSTIDVGRALEPGEIRRAERLANEIVFENRPVSVSYQDSSEDLDLRKPVEREGTIRIVSIDALDRSACGGTHVRATGEIGPLLIRKLDKIRGNLRIEFLCGLRAVERARADYEALSEIARAFSSPLDETPALVEAQREKLQEAEKSRQRMATEIAQARGRALYLETQPSADGIRRVERRAATLSDELRAEAQSFTAGAKAAMLAFAENPAAVLLAVSADSGIHAGTLLKEALATVGGRGGGSATLSQGSVADRAGLDVVAMTLKKTLGLDR